MKVYSEKSKGNTAIGSARQPVKSSADVVSPFMDLRPETVQLRLLQRMVKRVSPQSLSRQVDTDVPIQRTRIDKDYEGDVCETEEQLHEYVFNTPISDDGKTLYQLVDILWDNEYHKDLKKNLSKGFLHLSNLTGILYRALKMNKKAEGATLVVLKDMARDLFMGMKGYINGLDKKEKGLLEKKTIEQQKEQELARQLKTWNKVKGPLMQGAEGAGGRAYCRAFLINGRYVAEGMSGDGFKFFEVVDGKVEPKVAGEAAKTLARELNKVGAYRKDLRNVIQCAEIPAAYQALRQGYSLGNLYFATAKLTDEKVHLVERCENCLQWIQPMDPKEKV